MSEKDLSTVAKDFEALDKEEREFLEKAKAASKKKQELKSVLNDVIKDGFKTLVIDVLNDDDNIIVLNLDSELDIKTINEKLESTGFSIKAIKKQINSDIAENVKDKARKILEESPKMKPKEILEKLKEDEDISQYELDDTQLRNQVNIVRLEFKNND